MQHIEKSGDNDKNTDRPRSVYIATYGCQMNTRDSELVLGQFLKNGYAIADSPEDADVILFNTCSVRQHAEDKVWSELGRLKKLKAAPPSFAPPSFAKAKLSRGDNNSNNKIIETIPPLISSKSKAAPPSFAKAKLSRGDNHPAEKIIGVIGCMAKNLGDKIIERMPHVDLVCSPNDLSHIYDYVKEIQGERQHVVAISSEERDRSFYKHLHHQDEKHCYVNISEGCSNFCSYCIVPYVRGKHRSRPLPDIIAEIEQLVKDGVSSITLLGQNVNDYEWQKTEGRKQKTEDRNEHRASSIEYRGITFVELVELISNIPGVKELSFVTSHPKDVDVRLFDLMARKQNIKKYLHLPIQSGSNKILKAMNRKYTREKYLKIIAAYRKKVPDGILATDVIAGFPGETKKDFNDTRGVIKKAEFNFAYIFKYSPRPHTAAERLKDSVPLAEKRRRHQILLEEQKKISKRLKTEDQRPKT